MFNKMKVILLKKMPNTMYLLFNLKSKIKKNRTVEQRKKSINRKYKKYVNQKGINWKYPRSYTEKLNYSKLYMASNEKTVLTDKVLVRDWVKNKIGESYLVPIIGVYSDFDSIDFTILPNRFVIKCNHDSNSVTICEKKNINIKKLKKKYSLLLKRNYAYAYDEMHYKNIQPKIIIEEYLGDNIQDYKFLCFEGKPYFCWVDFDRFTNHKRNVYDMNWNLQPFTINNYGNYTFQFEKPKQFNEMEEIVDILCKGFDHVRVDLYIVKDKVYFGEMTFTNGSGYGKIMPKEWDVKIGDLWNLKEASEK